VNNSRVRPRHYKQSVKLLLARYCDEKAGQQAKVKSWPYKFRAGVIPTSDCESSVALSRIGFDTSVPLSDLAPAPWRQWLRHLSLTNSTTSRRDAVITWARFAPRRITSCWWSLRWLSSAVTSPVSASAKGSRLGIRERNPRSLLPPRQRERLLGRPVLARCPSKAARDAQSSPVSDPRIASVAGPRTPLAMYGYELRRWRPVRRTRFADDETTTAHGGNRATARRWLDAANISGSRSTSRAALNNVFLRTGSFQRSVKPETRKPGPST
jgi:hypothetical protein